MSTASQNGWTGSFMLMAPVARFILKLYDWAKPSQNGWTGLFMLVAPVARFILKLYNWAKPRLLPIAYCLFAFPED